MKKVLAILVIAALGSGIAAFAASPPKKPSEPQRRQAPGKPN